MAKARPRRKPARRRPRGKVSKATARRRKNTPVRAGKRKSAKRAAARRPHRVAVRASRPARAEKPRSRKIEDAVLEIPEIPPPLPAPIASFTF